MLGPRSILSCLARRSAAHRGCTACRACLFFHMVFPGPRSSGLGVQDLLVAARLIWSHFVSA